MKQRISARIRNLEDERAARFEAAYANREAIRSQISRDLEILRRIIHEDTTLAERINTLLREQGITVVSVLTAIGMITAIGMTISTLVLALTGGAAPLAQVPLPNPVMVSLGSR